VSTNSGRFGQILIPMLRSTIVWAFRAALRVQKSWSMNSSSSSSSLNGPISSSQERLLLPLQRLTPHSRLDCAVRDPLTPKRGGLECGIPARPVARVAAATGDAGSFPY
jgi:hypothetical protein